MNISEVETYLKKYRKIIIFADEVTAKWFRETADKSVGDDVLILFEETDIKHLYTLYEFTDKITVISTTESWFAGPWNLYNTGIIGSEELLKLVIDG